MQSTVLENTIANHKGYLRTYLTNINKGKALPASYFNAGFSYRILAICMLLDDMDVHTYLQYLNYAGCCRYEFLAKVATGLTTESKYLCLSKDVSFVGVLASGNYDLARDIARLSVKNYFPQIEYEDDFLLIHAMQQLLLNEYSESEFNAMFTRWDTVLEGQTSPDLLVCQAIHGKNDEEFAEYFQALLEKRELQMQNYNKTINKDPSLIQTEGKVFLEGVALLRLAQLNGLRVASEYNMIPTATLVDPGRHIFTCDGWKQIRSMA